MPKRKPKLKVTLLPEIAPREESKAIGRGRYRLGDILTALEVAHVELNDIQAWSGEIIEPQPPRVREQRE